MTINYIYLYYDDIHNLDIDDYTDNSFDVRRYMEYIDIVYSNFNYKVEHMSEYNLQDVLNDYMYAEKYLRYYELYDDIINKEPEHIKTHLITYFTTRIQELEQLRDSILYLKV